MRSETSLLGRLVLWQSAALTVSLGVLSLSLFLIVGHRLRGHHDEDLTEGCRQVGQMVSDYDEYETAGESHLREHIDELGLDVTLVPAEEVEPRPASVEMGEIWLTTQSKDELQHDAHGHEGTGAMRIASGVFQGRNGRHYLVRVSENLGDVSSTLRSLQVVILTVAPMVLLISIGVGAWIISNALNPLRSIVRSASSMDVNQLNDQIEVEGGSREIVVLSHAFNQMIERLALSFERVREFNANASHELRTPLTSLTASLEVALEKERTSDEYRRVMNQALLEVRHLTRIVENLLVMSQTDTGQVSLETRRVDLGAVLVDSVEAVHFRGNDDVAVEVEVDDDQDCMVEGDPHWLRQLFDNLLDNAVKYTPPGGTVKISTAEKGDVIEVCIADSGIGIPEEEVSQVFERYRRVSSERANGVPGVGLGLSIADWVARAHQGRIEIESTVGHGSKFTVVLPRKGA